MLLQMPVFHFFFYGWYSLVCVCVYFLTLCSGGNILGCKPPVSPVLPPEAPGEGPSCLFQLLGARGGPGLVAASLFCILLHVASPLGLFLLCLLGGHCPWMEGPPHPGGLGPCRTALNHSKFLILVSRASVVFPEKPKLTYLC